MGENTYNWLENVTVKNQVAKILETNAYAEHYGLSLSEEEAKLLVTEQKHSLQEQRRVEFGQSILPQIIQEFCDSAYIDQNNYAETLIRLQDIFYLYKNEMMDEITDDELLHFMKEQFETICYGDLSYLEETCLAIFAQAIRAGYNDYQTSEGYSGLRKLDIVPRWDKSLFLKALEELCEG